MCVALMRLCLKVLVEGVLRDCGLSCCTHSQRRPCRRGKEKTKHVRCVSAAVFRVLVQEALRGGSPLSCLHAQLAQALHSQQNTTQETVQVLDVSGGMRADYKLSSHAEWNTQHICHSALHAYRAPCQPHTPCHNTTNRRSNQPCHVSTHHLQSTCSKYKKMFTCMLCSACQAGGPASVPTVVPSSCSDVSCCSCAMDSNALLPMLLALIFNERCCRLLPQESATA
jgi:hypothetical protein